jgi:sialate O-acetylesterase
MKVVMAVALVLGMYSSASIQAEIRLPSVISDHAVLQRDRPIHIWGWSKPGISLKVSLDRQTAMSVADALGRWSVYLRPEPAGGPYELTVDGDDQKKTIEDILIGDVWLASGQSNMEMPLAGFPPTAVVKDAEKEIAAARNPRLRLLLVAHRSADVPQNDVDPGSTWSQCTPETAKRFSAVAYFFGRSIAEDQKVPIGLIDSTWGGTPADSWTSLDTLGSDPRLLPAFASRAEFADRQADLDAQIAAEKREDQVAKAEGKPAPIHPWHPQEASWLPAGLYNGMIAPLAPMTIKGFLWYQGETNSAHDRAYAYGSLFAALIGDWRMHFAQGNLPFLYVQISSFSSPGEDWGMVRDQQRRALSVANTAMIVTLDVGLASNVHPPDKQTVGTRLALAARGLVYTEPVPFQGPSFREADPEINKDGDSLIRVWFDHADGLAGRDLPAGGFEVADDDHHFVAARARIEGSSVLVYSDAVRHPRYVRYGWMGVVPSYLFNVNGLPASTFSSESTPID